MIRHPAPRCPFFLPTFTLYSLLLVFLLLLSSSLVLSAGRPRMRSPIDRGAILSQPTSITLTHERPVSPLPPHNVTLTPHHFCLSCHLMVQEFFRFILGSLNQDQFQGKLDASALASLFCQGEPFSHWQPFYGAACQELIFELVEGKVDTAGVNRTLEDFFAPLLGQRTVKYYVDFPLKELVSYKADTCHRLAQCPAPIDPIGPLPTHPSTECADCDRAAFLMAEAIAREVDVEGEGIIDFLVRNVCTEVAFHVEKPSGVEGACIEMLEDPDWMALVKKAMRKEGKAMKEKQKSVEAVHASLRRELCIKMTAACPPELKRSGGGAEAKEEL